MSLLIAVDAGNTQITLGAFRDKTLTKTWHLHTHPHYTADELGTQWLNLLQTSTLNAREVSGVVIASVVPSLDAALAEASSRYLGRAPLVVNAETPLGIRNLYKSPREVGADRLVNAVAAHALVGVPVIVVDFGTATTFDCVSGKGDYLGGVIAPGLEIAQEVLASRAAKLPRIAFQIPSSALGKTTVDSLQSGLFYGYIGLIEGVFQRLAKEMRGRPKGLATGGLAPVIGPHIKMITRIMPTLTLEGLRLIWEHNR